MEGRARRDRMKKRLTTMRNIFGVRSPCAPMSYGMESGSSTCIPRPRALVDFALDYLKKF